MVVLIKKIANFPHKSKPKKLDHSEAIALQSFKSTLSESLHKLFLYRQNVSNAFSLSWFITCFKFIQGMNTAFAKLVKELDYPTTKWKGSLAEDYFTYTLSMLDGLNSISSSISHMGSSRLTLSHAVSLVHNSPSAAIQHLKPIMPRNVEGVSYKEMSDGSSNFGKERVIHEAMVKMRGVDMVIMRAMSASLCGGRDGNFGLLGWGKLEGFDVEFGEHLMVIKEIEEVNEAVKKVQACLVGEMKNKRNEAAQELKKKLSELEGLLDMVGKEVSCLFSEVLARRNELMDCLRLSKAT